MHMRQAIVAALAGAVLLSSAGLTAQQTAGVLLFEIGIHVEPFGLSDSDPADYADEDYFRRHAEYLRSLAAVAEKHGGRLTIQVQSPFIDYAPRYDNVIGELYARGHEIGFHFHEDAHLGRNSGNLSVKRWSTLVGAQIDKIKALGVDRVRHWSGGNLYSHMLEVAAATGLDVKSDWKDPATQSIDPRLKKTTPWRPAGSPDGTDVTLFAQHDPGGAMVFLPPGISDPFGSVRDAVYASSRPSAALQKFWSDGLAGSLSSAAQNPTLTHTFHITLHPGDLQLNRLGGDTTLDTWLSREIDPLFIAGTVRWGTYSQIADAYIAAGR
jgi:hypothetical protein